MSQRHRGIGRHCRDAGAPGSHRQREAGAQARSGERDVANGCLRLGEQGFHGAEGIGIGAEQSVRFRVFDAVGEQAGVAGVCSQKAAGDDGALVMESPSCGGNADALL